MRSEPSKPEALQAAYEYAEANDCAPADWVWESWRAARLYTVSTHQEGPEVSPRNACVDCSKPLPGEGNHYRRAGVAGWTRLRRDGVNVFRCPDCRPERRPRAGPVEEIVAVPLAPKPDSVWALRFQLSRTHGSIRVGPYGASSL